MLLPLDNLSPDDFEEFVYRELRKWGRGLQGFQAKRLELVPGAGGEYEIDIEVRFSALAGAEFIVLVECKRYSNPVKREVLLALESKLRDTKAQKAIIFSTSRFQRGALEFAAAHHIATVEVCDSGASYVTRSFGSMPPKTGRPFAMWVSPTDTGWQYAGIHKDAEGPWSARLAS